MAKVILLHSIVGDDFSFKAGRMIEVSDATKASFIAEGIARELTADEPTEDQLVDFEGSKPDSKETKASSPSTEEAKVAVEDPAPAPKRKRKNGSGT